MEDFVTYRQAKKLCNLGFDFKCIAYYDEGEFEYADSYSDYNSEHYRYNLMSAPTLAQVQKWLREKKNINVYIVPQFSGLYECHIQFKRQGYGGDEEYDTKNTYEEALSSGINRAINFLMREEKDGRSYYF